MDQFIAFIASKGFRAVDNNSSCALFFAFDLYLKDEFIVDGMLFADGSIQVATDREIGHHEVFESKAKFADWFKPLR